MQRQDLSEQVYESLLEAIIPEILDNGPKSTTMDAVAARLQMSKRTLYEIFESKEKMVIEALSLNFKKIDKKNRQIYESTPNVLEALLKIFAAQRDIMSRVSAQFFRDLDTIYSRVRRCYDDIDRRHEAALLEVIRKGVSQGMFRPEINYPVLSRLMKVQMESLKRMEEVFPPEITLLEAFDSISIGFLRSIATPKGSEILDSIISNFENAPISSPANLTISNQTSYTSNEP